MEWGSIGELEWRWEVAFARTHHSITPSLHHSSSVLAFEPAFPTFGTMKNLLGCFALAAGLSGCRLESARRCENA